jgi:hypothetical protein
VDDFKNERRDGGEVIDPDWAAAMGPVTASDDMTVLQEAASEGGNATVAVTGVWVAVVYPAVPASGLITRSVMATITLQVTIGVPPIIIGWQRIGQGAGAGEREA